MSRKAISVYTMFIIILIGSFIIFAVLMIRMFVLQTECLNLQHICSLQILAFCGEWYGEDEFFEPTPPNKKYVWYDEEKDLSCVMKAAKTQNLNFCYVYNGTKPKDKCIKWIDDTGSEIDCKAVEWGRDEVDCYCKPYKYFCEGLIEEAIKEKQE